MAVTRAVLVLMVGILLFSSALAQNKKDEKKTEEKKDPKKSLVEDCTKAFVNLGGADGIRKVSQITKQRHVRLGQQRLVFRTTSKDNQQATSNHQGWLVALKTSAHPRMWKQHNIASEQPERYIIPCADAMLVALCSACQAAAEASAQPWSRHAVIR